MKKIFNLVLLFIVVVSCKTITSYKSNQRIATSPIELGTIGELKPSLEINKFQSKAIPRYEKKIRLTKRVLPFDKGTFRAYKKASKLQGKEVVLKYVDSLPNKPKYVSFTILDIPSVLEQITNDNNKSIIELLKVKPKAKMVTSLSLSFSDSIIKSINEAEEVFFVNTHYKKYHLELYKNNKIFKHIEFSEGIAFEYKLSSFCWVKENYQVKLIDVIRENGKCSEGTISKFKMETPKKQTIKF